MANQKEQQGNPRSQVQMYEDQDKFIKANGDSVAEYLKKRCEAMVRKYSLKEYALIHHDKDQVDGRPVETHWHLVMFFGDHRPMVSSIADALGTTPNHIEVMTKRGTKVETARANAFMYLIHATRNARREGKYQYSPEEVIANFDYVKFAKGHLLKDSPDQVLEDLGEGKITRTQAQARMMEFGALTLSKYKRKIDEVAEAALAIQYAKWRGEHEGKHSKLMVLWFCGETGTGKTRYAKYLAKNAFKMPYFVTGATRDTMQDYEGEHLIIWDELRNDVEYTELLRLLDPYNYEKSISSRYYNKALMPEVIIITSPYRPDELYKVLSVSDRKRDKVDQLVRRVPVLYEFQKEQIRILRWNIYNREYWNLTGDVMPSVTELVEEDSHKDDTPAEPFYGLEDYAKHLNNNVSDKEKSPYDSPKLRKETNDSTLLSDTLSHPNGGGDNE